MPTMEGEVNFNLICDVNRKASPLSLNVKATGHTMNLTVKYEQSNTVTIELYPDQVNTIHFKEVRKQKSQETKGSLTHWWHFNPNVLFRSHLISPGCLELDIWQC